MSVASENCLPVGTRLSDFEITGVLGEGGFGIVYIAFDHALQRTVAIKEYMPGALAARDVDHSVTMRAERHRETFQIGLKSFINEARFLAQFDHPALVKVYRFWEQNQTAYTAMQYYDGRTIKDIVERSPETVSEAWCARIMGQILDALEMLYTMQLVHRDVSPDNIIVQPNGDAVLLDFGSARQIIGDMTRGLTVILKPGYAPVEQYAGDATLAQGPYTDIYALSAVMYFAITCEAPPTSIARMIKDPVQPLASRALAGYSTAFLAAIDKGMAVLAEQRPQTIDAMRAMLGMAPASAPRARPAGSTQRFATVQHAPVTIPLAGSTDAATSASAPASAQPRVPSGAPASVPPAPARASKRIAAIGGGVLVLAAIVMYAMFGRPADTVMVAPSQVPLAGEPVQVTAPAASAPTSAPPASTPATAPAAARIAAAPPVMITDDAPDTAAATKSAEPVIETATYKLSIKPWGTIYVDGKERGVSPPLKRIALPAGRHKIRIVNPGFADYQTEVALGASKTGAIDHDFSKSTETAP